MASRYTLTTPQPTFAGSYNTRPTTSLQTASTRMDPMTLSLILQGAGAGLSGLTSLLSSGDNREMTREQLQEQRRQFDASSRQRAAEQSLLASQMDPLTQQRSRQRSALVAQLLAGAQPTRLEGNQFTGGSRINPEIFKAIASYFSPEANAAAEAAFTANANTASANQYTAPTPQSVGYPSMAAPSGAAVTSAATSNTATPRNPFYDGDTDARRPRRV